jgi:outer membrane protein OmpA-like peptidoglycan-associated protein
MKRYYLLPLLMLSLLLLKAYNLEAQQHEERVKDPGKNLAKHCKEPLMILRSMPPEARYATRIYKNSIYIIFSDPAVYAALIKGSKDGFAIDLVHARQYSCTTPAPTTKSRFRGQLQQPLYKEELSTRMQQDATGTLYINMGTLPAGMDPEEVEANLVLIHKRYACHYLSIYDLDMQDWELLETGLYRDTLHTVSKGQKESESLTKTLYFTIPFAKNQYDYKQQDIKALYDSLKLTDYTINALRIVAYTSVEGSLEHNLQLQQRRAESLVKALEAYQGLPVKASIRTSENWVEFLEDISTTPHKQLAQLSKQQIKEKLKEPAVSQALEPLLSRHRKGLVTLRLQKKVSYFQESAENMKRYYNQAIAEENVEKALMLQEIIFERIQQESLPEEFAKQLEVPQTTLFGRLLLNQASFSYGQADADELAALQTFEELQQILPDNPQLAYNITALKIKIWAQDPSLADARELNQNILNLRKLNLEDALVNRLLINFYIIQTQRHLFERNYREKDKSLLLIYKAYKNLRLSDSDAVRLASFFAFYSRFDWSRAVLQSRVKQLDVHENVIFYYLNLTLGDNRYTRSKDYRQILNNAFNTNPLRYCSMFGTRGSGGVSFQLLQDQYLKQTFCDNCNDTASGK